MHLDFSGLKILCIGDPMVDRYIFGRVDRISPEAPVPVFVAEHEEERMGGAANVVEQLRTLGCDVEAGWIEHSPAYTVKTRYMVGSHQLLRVDDDQYMDNAIPSLNGFHAIVISDYAKGACTPEVCQEAIKSGLPVIVDPKGSDWSKYEGAKVVCPNDAEYKGWVRNGWTPPVIVHKMGAKGIDLWLDGLHPKYEHTHYPSVARHVFDVCGAGDSVVAVIAACVANGISYGQACQLANIAAGYVVGEVGTTVCPLEYLCKEAAYL